MFINIDEYIQFVFKQLYIYSHINNIILIQIYLTMKYIINNLNKFIFYTKIIHKITKEQYLLINMTI